MRKIIFYSIMTITILIIPVLFYGIINTSVSQKYETTNQNECISTITGEDLCLKIKIMEFIIAFCILIVIGLAQFRKQLLEIN